MHFASPTELNTYQPKERPIFAFKVTNSKRNRTLGIVASDFLQLKSKCEQKFGLENVMFVIEEDGCEVDSEYLAMITPDTKLMCLCEGETWSSTNRKEPVPEREEHTVMTLIEDLRRKKLKTERNQTSKAKERTVSVQVGWCNYSFRDKRYQLVKMTKDKPNSGPRMIKLDRTLNMSSVTTWLKELFFPQGKSPLGSQKNFTFHVGTYLGDIIEPSVTLDEYVSAHAKPRLYLLSKSATLLSVLDSDSDSDFELPRIEFLKENRRKAVSATVTSASVDNMEDGSQIELGLSEQNRTEILSQNSASNEVSCQSALVVTIVDQTAPNEQTAEAVLASGSTSGDGSFIFINSGTPTVDLKVSASNCPVCFDRPKDTVLLPCGHAFCHPCSVHLVTNNLLCPLCRRRIDKYSCVNC